MSILPLAIERGLGHVTVFLKRNEAAPPLPYELQNMYTHDVWATRVQAATQLCRQWTRPLIERIYFFSVVLIQFIIPSLVSSQVLLKMYATGPDGEIPPDKFFAFRAIGMAVFVGTLLLFWTPLIIWKTLGKRKLRALETEWLTIDRATARGGFVPRWTITKAGIFSSTEAIRVTVPQASIIVTNFHPQATLPPYINPAPAYPGANAYGYPQDEKIALESDRV